MITPKDLDAIEDPRELFELTSSAIAEYQEMTDQMSAIRMRAIAALHAQGASYKDLATELGLSAPRVGQLVTSNDVSSIRILKAWVQVEQKLIQIAELAGSRQRAPVLTALEILSNSTFDRRALEELERLRKIRNDLVHGNIGKPDDLVEGTVESAELLNALLVLWIRENREVSLPSGVRIGPREDVGQETLTRLAVEKRHGELAPSTHIKFAVEKNGRTGLDELWAYIRNLSSRAYRFRGQMFWQENSWSDFYGGELLVDSQAKVFLSNMPTHPKRIKVQYVDLGWEDWCPCNRQRDFGHWAETRAVQVQGG